MAAPEENLGATGGGTVDLQRSKRKRRYDQEYKSSWENDEQFKAWVVKSSKGSHYSYCKFCKVDISNKSGKHELRKHSSTYKHMDATEKADQENSNVAKLIPIKYLPLVHNYIKKGEKKKIIITEMASPRSYIIDMRSDTVTKPTASMRKAMAEAPVGDDVYCEDPTVSALERKIANILGKPAALFVASGTMANLISVMVHCNQRGSEFICGDKCHIYKYEQGGVAQFGGVMMTTLKNNDDGTFSLDELKGRIRGEDIHEPKTVLVTVENTHNVCGGKVLPMHWIEQLGIFAKENNLLLHMDGARLFNAAHFLGIDPSEIVKHFDSVSVCFSKGLGAPVGSAVAGSLSFIRQARRVRKALGGGMRQVGVIAAPAIVALDEIVPALIGDHRRAKFLAEVINSLRSSTFTVDIANVQTNILMIYISPESNVTSTQVVARFKMITEAELKGGCTTDDGEGILLQMISMGPKVLRLTTHFEISDTDVNYAIKKIALVLKEMEPKKGFFG